MSETTNELTSTKSNLSVTESTNRSLENDIKALQTKVADQGTMDADNSDRYDRAIVEQDRLRTEVRNRQQHRNIQLVASLFAYV